MMLVKVNKSWITLIEVMIAIIVFGIGVLTVMSMITANIWMLYDIREKDTAIMIAKEWIDLMYHVRDSNIERNGFRNCAITDTNAEWACSEYFYDDDDKYFTIGMSLTWSYDISVIPTTWDASTEIRYHTGVLYTSASGATLDGFWYNHISDGGEETIYKRRIAMRPVPWYEAFTWSILEITSHVAYDRWNRSKNITLQSFIGDIR